MVSTSASHRGAVGIAAAALLLLSLAVARGWLPGPPCLFRQALGMRCLGCGLSHSFAALWRGDMWEASRINPMGPPVFALLTVLALRGIWRRT